MKTQLEERLAQLRDEYQSGQRLQAELETRQANLRETMLRISGAIQVLEEMLQAASADMPALPQPNGADEAVIAGA